MKISPLISSGATAEFLLFWLFPHYFKSEAKIKITDNILGLEMPCIGYRA